MFSWSSILFLLLLLFFFILILLRLLSLLLLLICVFLLPLLLLLLVRLPSPPVCGLGASGHVYVLVLMEPAANMTGSADFGCGTSLK